MNVDEISPGSKDYRQVKIVIGGDGKQYEGSLPQFAPTAVHSRDGSGNVVLLLPDSVAEYFRREGRRQLQSEFRLLLNSARA